MPLYSTLNVTHLLAYLLRFHVRAPTYYQRARDLEWYLAQLESESGSLSGRLLRPSSQAGGSVSPAEQLLGPAPGLAVEPSQSHAAPRSPSDAATASSPLPAASPAPATVSTENDAGTAIVAAPAPLTLAHSHTARVLGAEAAAFSPASPALVSHFQAAATVASSASPTLRTASPDADANVLYSAEQTLSVCALLVYFSDYIFCNCTQCEC